MSRLSQSLRNRRQVNRSRRAIEKAIVDAGSPALRDELIAVAQRHVGLSGR